MKTFVTLTLGSVLLLPQIGKPGDWPTYGHDAARRCVTEEKLRLPLSETWTFRTRHQPRPAWTDPAPQDFWHRLSNLQPTMTFDRAFQVVGADGMVYFGTSADDQVIALDARTGQRRWSFSAEGPIRLAPTLIEDRLYLGSDDGFVYCLQAADGALIWRCRGADSRRVLPGNSRLMSLWPIRSGVVVDGDAVYFTAGLFPQQDAFLCSAAADTGALRWRARIDSSPQGYLLADDDHLYIPSGRTQPWAFRKKDGAVLGALPSSGGTYAMLDREVMVAGPGRGSQQLVISDIASREGVATLAGRQLIVREDQAYLLSEKTLAALERGRFLALSRQRNKAQQLIQDLKKRLQGLPKEGQEARVLRERLRGLADEVAELNRRIQACYRWQVPCDQGHAMILAGDTLFVGGEKGVSAFAAQGGEALWQAPVSGRAYGLSVTDGALIVSTDAGQVHCFRPGASGERRIIEPPAAVDPFADDPSQALFRTAAQAIAEQVGARQGYCLILNCGEGQLACELARRTELQIVGLTADADAAARARRALRRAGVYGRVIVRQQRDRELPFARYFANLIVLDGTLSGARNTLTREQIRRYTRPYGGAVLTVQDDARFEEAALAPWGHAFGGPWRIHRDAGVALAWQRRDALAGAGQWTHLYGDAGNSACSGDERVRGEMTIQWFGKPGASRMIDRHHRNIPPLFCDGTLYVPGDRIVYAVDAYNGAPLWDIEIPDSRRLGVFLDGGSMVVDSERLYVVAGDRCHAYDTKSGRPSFVHSLPSSVDRESSRWGVLALSDRILLGSVCRREASYRLTSYDADNALWYRNMEVVTSRMLFACNKDESKALWTYEDGLILNATVTVGAGRVHFVATDNPAALADPKGRMPIKKLFAQGRPSLVALDLATGRLLYRRPLDVRDFEEPVYLNLASETLLLSGSKLHHGVVHYYYQAFHAPSGDIRWQADHATALPTDGGHGEYNRHPTLVGDRVYAWPYAYSLTDGTRVPDWEFSRQGHGCGGVSASAQSLFWRGGNPWRHDLDEEGGAQRLNAVSRPGCWINMIPAGGLLLIPEASSGCTCAFPLQTSMALIPVSVEP